MLRDLKNSQRLMRSHQWSVTGATGAVTAGTESADGTVTRDAQGVYTVQFAFPFARLPFAMVQTRTSATQAHISAKTISDIEISTENNSGTDTDADFDLLVWGSDSRDQV